MHSLTTFRWVRWADLANQSRDLPRNFRALPTIELGLGDIAARFLFPGYARARDGIENGLDITSSILRVESLRLSAPSLPLREPAKEITSIFAHPPPLARFTSGVSLYCRARTTAAALSLTVRGSYACVC